MYLDDGEKTRLAASVRAALVARGGAWITADIYVRSAIRPQRDARTQAFLDQHRVEERKFADRAAATAFFAAVGFELVREVAVDVDPWPVRETWVLAPTGRAGRALG